MMDEEAGGSDVTAMTVGERLRAAREASGMSLDELATVTRIPTRHLSSLEESDFAKLPAPTYTIGFAKNYANAVGLDRAEIAEDLRAELGSTRPQTFEVETYEPADPRRAMPKSLIIGALAAILLVVLGFTWLNNRDLEGDDEAVPATANEAPVVAAPATPAAAPAVSLTATEAVWVEIKDGMAILKQGEMAPGESFVVPANAAAPTLTTGKPEALAIKVGETAVPPVGEAGKRVKDVSLLAADLTKPRAAAAPAATPPPTAARPATPAPRARPAPRPQPRQPAIQPPPPPPPADPQPVANNTQ